MPDNPQAIDDLAPHPDNPRKIKDKARQGLRTSLEKFGDLSGITYNTQTGHLVCGHQRLRELRELGGEYRDGSVWVGSREYRVRLVDWDEQTEREANVAANNEFIQGDWDETAFDFLAQIRAGMAENEFSDLSFDDLADSISRDAPAKSADIVEWDASAMVIECRFSFTGPIELQAKARKVLAESFPDAKWTEDLTYG